MMRTVTNVVEAPLHDLFLREMFEPPSNDVALSIPGKLCSKIRLIAGSVDFGGINVTGL